MANHALSALLRLKTEFTPLAAQRKRELLSALSTAVLGSADEVLQLHECLCFHKAYPDDALVLEQATALLRDFARRKDLQAHAEALADSGIAGTVTTYPFFAPTAARLACKCPDRLTIAWDEDDVPALDKALPLLSLYAETPALDELPLSTREWIDLQRGAATDAHYVIARMRAVHRDDFVFERAYEGLGLWLRLAPGPGSPSRTTAAAPVRQTAFQRGPLQSGRPDLARVLRQRPAAIRQLSPKEGARYVELAQDAMCTRQRDLDAFAYGDARDVRLVEWADGLTFAVIGVVPQRRLLLEAVYAFLTLKNGVPIGYVLNSALFGSAEIAYNVFEAFRGAEAGRVYGAVLATVRALFGVDSFTIYPYQLGDDNDEALQSGAWWFYQKLGFRPRDPQALGLMAAELGRMQRNSRHRSSIATLRKLAEHNVYFHLRRQRDDVIGEVDLAEIGRKVSAMLARRYGPDRERGEAELLAEAAKLLGIRRPASLAVGARLALRRWAPLLALLPGVGRWPKKDLTALRAVVLAKGGRAESDFVAAFDGHRRLRKAVLLLARSG